MTIAFTDIKSTLDKNFTGVTAEPVDLADVLLHARVDGLEESESCAAYITSARIWVENELDTALAQRSVTLTLDEFPDDEIEFRFPPLNSITSIVYLDSSGASTTLSTSLYRVDTAGRPPRITPAYGQLWPYTYPVTSAITITASVGYSSAASVPVCAKQAIYYLAALMFKNREPSPEDLSIVRRILDPLRWTSEVI